jgi:hypothetical protein
MITKFDYYVDFSSNFSVCNILFNFMHIHFSFGFKVFQIFLMSFVTCVKSNVQKFKDKTYCNLLCNPFKMLMH